MLRKLGTGARGQGPGAGTLLLLFGALVQGAILPDQIGNFAKGETKILAPEDPSLYQELGFVAGEQAQYAQAGKRFMASAWRLRDSTGALALFEALRPPAAAAAKVAALFSKTPDGAIFAYGNYVFQVSGAVPAQAIPEQKDLELLYAGLPQLDRAPLPALVGYLPENGRIPNSERYVLGPASLARFEPRIAPSLAAFHVGAEGQLARYRTPKGDLTLAIFSYPTPNLAREREQEFAKTPGTIAKRSGPLVAVVVQPPDPDAAEQVLARVQYAGNLTLNENITENPVQQMGKLVFNGFVLAGVLGAFSIIVGIGFGGFRVIRRKLGKPGQDDPFQLLRIGDK